MLQANIGCRCWLWWSCAVHPKNHVHQYYDVIYGNASQITGPLWGEPTFVFVDSLHNGSDRLLYKRWNWQMPWCSCYVTVLNFSHGLHPFGVSQVPANFMHILPYYSSDIDIDIDMIWNETNLTTERLSLSAKHYTCGTTCVSTTTVFHPLILPSVSQFPLTGDLHVTVRGPFSKYEPKMVALSEPFIHWINFNYPPTACHVVCNSLSGRTKLLVTKETILKWFAQWKIFPCWCQFH